MEETSYLYGVNIQQSENNGKWMFDYTLTAHNALGAKTESLWPAEILPFFNEVGLPDNNFWVDIDDYSWMRPSVVIDDVLSAKICFLFQDKSGNILAGVNIKNGKDSEQIISKLHLHADDKVFGKMFDIAVDGDIIPSKQSKTLIVHISSDLVSDKAKAQTWSEPCNLKADITV